MKTKKKLLVLALVAALALTLSACGNKKETVALTTENIEEYLTINTEVSSNVSTQSKSIMGIYVKSYSGQGTIEIDTVRQSDVEFENVTITCKVSTETFPRYGWEFISGNEQTLWEDGGVNDNYKTITLTIPLEGNTNTSESLELVPYVDGKDMIMSPSEMKNCWLSVTDVTGNVIIK